MTRAFSDTVAHGANFNLYRVSASPGSVDVESRSFRFMAQW